MALRTCSAWPTSVSRWWASVSAGRGCALRCRCRRVRARKLHWRPALPARRRAPARVRRRRPWPRLRGGSPGRRSRSSRAASSSGSASRMATSAIDCGDQPQLLRAPHDMWPARRRTRSAPARSRRARSRRECWRPCVSAVCRSGRKRAVRTSPPMTQAARKWMRPDRRSAAGAAAASAGSGRSTGGRRWRRGAPAGSSPARAGGWSPSNRSLSVVRAMTRPAPARRARRPAVGAGAAAGRVWRMSASWIASARLRSGL